MATMVLIHLKFSPAEKKGKKKKLPLCFMMSFYLYSILHELC